MTIDYRDSSLNLYFEIKIYSHFKINYKSCRIQAIVISHDALSILNGSNVCALLFINF